MNSPEHAQTTQPSQVSQPPDQQLGEMLSALSEKMEKLSDTISRNEAQMLCRLDAVEEKLEDMQEDLKKGTLSPEAFLSAPPVNQIANAYANFFADAYTRILSDAFKFLWKTA